MKIYLMLTIILVSSCATTAKYEEVLNSWVNRPSSELFSKWGAPNSSFTDSSGSKFYTFLYDGGAVGSTYLNPYGGATTYVNNYGCKTVFIANSQDIIQTWQWQGNACKAK